ncbi:MAG: tripartite tricarboxylate transporter substrate binding protein [Betaproteobacteria bacterium]|nr:tripartite tricarboxylate transporter substrate binding protein [Betaproteobacteria bacterium]
MKRNPAVRVCMVALLWAVTTADVVAQQQYPAARPIRVVAPFAPGGLVDVLSRALGEKLRPALGQPIVVDNRPGAGGNVGADLAAKAEPDGHTLLMTSAGILTINQFLYAKMPFDPVTAFTPISLVAEMHMLMVLNPNVPARTVPEFIALAKKDAGRLNFGSPGNGTTGHLGMEMLQAAAGVRLTHVPYKSAAEAALAVIGGQIHGVMDNPPTVLAHIRVGTLRAVAVASPKRLPQLPEVPTFDEAGLKGFEASSWFGMVAPAKTPRPVVARLNREIVRALGDAELQQRFTNLGARLAPNSPEEFSAFIKSERTKWEKIVRGANITLQ